MQLETALTRFEELLDEEKEAIRLVEAAHISRLAEEKEVLMHLLQAGGIAKRDDLLERFAELIVQLRHNLVLLVHAKACLRDVIDLKTHQPATYRATGRSAPARTGGRLSVSG